MRVILCLFDSLNRHMLGPYGGTAVPTPNFDRLAGQAATFDGHWVGSLPCMPARRDLQTGRLSFLHRSWGPLEPFDPSLGGALKTAGVYSHLATDHYHYWEEGGANYHTKYHSCDMIRGQEGDGWIGEVAPPIETFRERYHPAQVSDRMGSYPLRHMINRQHIRTEAEFPSVQTFDAAEAFIRRNQDADRWFLQIETFDPHEPFHSPDRFRAAEPAGLDAPIRDWPPYDRLTEPPEEAEAMRAAYRASLRHCDALLGRLLDLMDAEDMWSDTVLIVSTDHGYLLGEHDWWAKNRMPVWNEIARIPLFVHHPDHPGAAGTRIGGITQTFDLGVTVLDCFGLPPEAGMTGRSILPMLAGGDGRAAAIFGYFGGAVNITDGRHTYFRYPERLREGPLYQYTLMPAHIWSPFSRAELDGMDVVRDLPFARGWPVMRCPVHSDSAWYGLHGPGAFEDARTVLYDIEAEPGQERPLDDPAAEAALVGLLRRALDEHGAPPELPQRLGL